MVFCKQYKWYQIVQRVSSYQSNGDNLAPSFQILLFGLQREKTTSIFCEEIEKNLAVPVMSHYILSYNSVWYIFEISHFV